MTFVEKNLFNFTILMILKLTETKRKHNQPMKYFGISKTVSVKFPFRTPLLVCS